MADVLVTCINKPDRNSRHEHITHLGNPATPQGGWRWTREAVIASIESGTNTFFTRDPITGKRGDIKVAKTGLCHLPSNVRGWYMDGQSVVIERESPTKRLSSGRHDYHPQQ